MNTELQLKVQAYLDNELTPGEARKIANLISGDPEARALYQELRQTQELLADNEIPRAVPDSRDFYWSQLQRRIAAAERPAPEPSASPWWLRLVAPVAGAVALAAVLLSIQGPSTPSRSLSTAGMQKNHPFHEIVSTGKDVSAMTFRSEADGITFVWVTTE